MTRIHPKRKQLDKTIREARKRGISYGKLKAEEYAKLHARVVIPQSTDAEPDSSRKKKEKQEQCTLFGE